MSKLQFHCLFVVLYHIFNTIRVTSSIFGGYHIHIHPCFYCYILQKWYQNDIPLCTTLRIFVTNTSGMSSFKTCKVCVFISFVCDMLTSSFNHFYLQWRIKGDRKIWGHRKVPWRDGMLQRDVGPSCPMELFHISSRGFASPGWGNSCVSVLCGGLW
jgi:hypothetical protein